MERKSISSINFQLITITSQQLYERRVSIKNFLAIWAAIPPTKFHHQFILQLELSKSINSGLKITTFVKFKLNKQQNRQLSTQFSELLSKKIVLNLNS